MAYLIGTDEAGYGPNLGPLVISSSAWHVPDGVASSDLYRELRSIISIKPTRANGKRSVRVAIADSKTLYQSGKGLRFLEHGLWAAWHLLGAVPKTCGDVWELLGAGSAEHRCRAHCGSSDHLSVPMDADVKELEALRPVLFAAFERAGVRLIGLRSRAIFADEFNRTVEECGSKGHALSHWTLDLISRTMESLGKERISIVCDKHGGRDRYLPLLMECFPDSLIEVHAEGESRSLYRFGPDERRVDICFEAKGESHLPTALASMASKYLRELGMHALNGFWCQRVPSLRPTAGYPLDARRFKKQIEPIQRELEIEDRLLWRVK